jgi:hypothetical protein
MISVRESWCVNEGLNVFVRRSFRVKEAILNLKQPETIHSRRERRLLLDRVHRELQR